VIEIPPPLPESDWSLLSLENDGQHLSQAQLENQQEKLTNSLQVAQQQIHMLNLVIESGTADIPGVGPCKADGSSGSKIKEEND